MKIAVTQVAENEQAVLWPLRFERLAQQIKVSGYCRERQTDVKNLHRRILKNLFYIVAQRPQCSALRVRFCDNRVADQASLDGRGQYVFEPGLVTRRIPAQSFQQYVQTETVIHGGLTPRRGRYQRIEIAPH